MWTFLSTGGKGLASAIGMSWLTSPVQHNWVACMVQWISRLLPRTVKAPRMIFVPSAKDVIAHRVIQVQSTDTKRHWATMRDRRGLELPSLSFVQPSRFYHPQLWIVRWGPECPGLAKSAVNGDALLPIFRSLLEVNAFIARKCTSRTCSSTRRWTQCIQSGVAAPMPPQPPVTIVFAADQWSIIKHADLT